MTTPSTARKNDAVVETIGTVVIVVFFCVVVGYAGYWFLNSYLEQAAQREVRERQAHADKPTS